MISENRLMAIAALLTVSVVALTGYAVSLEGEPSPHGASADGASADGPLPDGASPDRIPHVGEPHYYAGNGWAGPVTIFVTSAQTVEAQEAGQQSLVTVNMNVTMYGNDALYLTPYFFKMMGSDGATYNFHYPAGFNMPESLTGGSTGQVAISFQVPPGVMPAQIVYYDVLYTVQVPLSGVWAEAPA